jgi:hypothetical protein
MGGLKIFGTLFGGFSLRTISPHRIVLHRLLHSLLNLLCAKTGVGTGELFAAFSHEGHGIKCLLLHGFTS